MHQNVFIYFLQACFTVKNQKNFKHKEKNMELKCKLKQYSVILKELFTLKQWKAESAAEYTQMSAHKKRHWHPHLWAFNWKTVLVFH